MRDPKILRLLIWLSLVAVLLVASDMLLNRSWELWYLPWNLLLAWMPLFFALLLVTKNRSRPLKVLVILLWITFLPNSYYMVTDMIHINDSIRISFWYDTVVFLTTILAGISAGSYSLFLLYRRHFRNRKYLMAGIVLLVSIGMYIGRQFRWNSWDLVAHPIGVVTNLSTIFLSFQSLIQFLVSSIGFTLLILISFEITRQFADTKI